MLDIVDQERERRGSRTWWWCVFVAGEGPHEDLGTWRLQRRAAAAAAAARERERERTAAGTGTLGGEADAGGGSQYISALGLVRAVYIRFRARSFSPSSRWIHSR